MRVDLQDGRVFEYQDESLSINTWGGQGLTKKRGVWRKLNPNGTTESVEAELRNIDGVRHLVINGEDEPARIR